MTQETIGPVTKQDRIQTIDFIRGFALLGIIIVNFTVDNPGIRPLSEWKGFGDQFAWWSIQFFLDDKFMAIYCLLFGLGFSIQMFRAKERHSSFVFIYLRRMIVLYIFGAINFIFFYGWDILGAYAIAGLLLLVVYKLPQKLLPVLALLCVLVPWTIDLLKTKDFAASPFRSGVTVDTAVLNTYVGVYQINEFRQIIIRKANTLICEAPDRRVRLVAVSENEFLAPTDHDVRLIFAKDSTGKLNRIIGLTGDGKELTAYKTEIDLQKGLNEQLSQRSQWRTGWKEKTYKEFITNNFNDFWSSIKSWSLFDFFRDYENRIVLAIFLLGLYAGKRKVFYEINANRTFFLKVMKLGFWVGMTCTAIVLGFRAWNYKNDIERDFYSPLIRGLNYLLMAFPGAVGMALGYVASMTLLLEKDRWKNRLIFLQPVGRIGLTNYLIQGVAYTFLFRSFGLGLDGKIGAIWRTILALLVFTLVVLCSRWWLKRFQYGPFEWLSRSLTYLKFQPMRINNPNQGTNIQ